MRASLFSQAASDRMKANGLKGRFRLDIGKKFLNGKGGQVPALAAEGRGGVPTPEVFKMW